MSKLQFIHRTNMIFHHMNYRKETCPRNNLLDILSSEFGNEQDWVRCGAGGEVAWFFLSSKMHIFGVCRSKKTNFWSKNFWLQKIQPKNIKYQTKHEYIRFGEPDSIYMYLWVLFFQYKKVTHLIKPFYADFRSLITLSAKLSKTLHAPPDTNNNEKYSNN